MLLYLSAVAFGNRCNACAAEIHSTLGVYVSPLKANRSYQIELFCCHCLLKFLDKRGRVGTFGSPGTTRGRKIRGRLLAPPSAWSACSGAWAPRPPSSEQQETRSLLSEGHTFFFSTPRKHRQLADNISKILLDKK